MSGPTAHAEDQIGTKNATKPLTVRTSRPFLIFVITAPPTAKILYCRYRASSSWKHGRIRFYVCIIDCISDTLFTISSHAGAPPEPITEEGRFTLEDMDSALQDELPGYYDSVPTFGGSIFDNP